MRYSITQKLNVSHLTILLLFPIILALINPNWIFNTYIIDDYIYLGYQIDLPGYIGWSPSDNYYFIERISWLLPTYSIRQIFSPLVANFIIHLAVYYLALFSVYGTINRLFHGRVALITSLLLGQFSLFLRSVGWDYVDGYAMAWLSFIMLLLTYGATSMRIRFYVLISGLAVGVMLVAQFFHTFYLPALGIYYLALNHHHQKHPFINALFWGILGVILSFGIQTLLYYQLTGRWFLWQNSFRIIGDALAPDGWRDLIRENYNYAVSSWHILYLGTLIIALWVIAQPKRFIGVYGENNTNFQYHLRISFIFFIMCYGVLGAWWLVLDYDYYRLPFYNSVILPSLFILLAGLFSGRLNRLSDEQFQTITRLTLLISLGLFALYTQLSFAQILLMWLMALILGILFFVFAFISKRQFGILNFICAITLLSYVSGIDIRYIGIFYPDRYTNQHIYEVVTEASAVINARYEDYRLENFRFWYTDDEPNTRMIFSLTSIYMHQFSRRITPIGGESEELRWDEDLYTTREIILVSTELSPDELVSKGNEILNALGYNLHVNNQVTIQNGMTTLQLVFTQVQPITEDISS